MSARVADVISVIDGLAPFRLAEEWDNVGLQVGVSDEDAGDILLSLNVDDDVIDEAVNRGCGLILTHHPLIFQPLPSVSDATAAGRLAREAVRRGVAVVAAHTNLDAAPGGLADIMAGLCGIAGAGPLSGSPAPWSKLVTFVPEGDLDRVREALFAAGGGVIGDYSHCSFFVEGTGTFHPLAGASPSLGEVGRDERVSELRLEMVFPPGREDRIVAALKEAHSYEEPAYDIYRLDTRCHDSGCGRAGELDRPISLEELAAGLASIFGMEQARFAGEPEAAVARVAVVPGSGAGMIGKAAPLADVLVTGGIKYHDLAQARESGLALVEIPHDVCERKLLLLWSENLAGELEPLGLRLEFSGVETGFWRSVRAGAGEGAGGAAANKTATGSDTARKGGGEGLHHLHVDGGARGNPGPAAIGAVLEDGHGNRLATISRTIGRATNNIAEYSALISGLEMALEHGVEELAVFSDSELVIRQLKGEYKVKNQGLKPLYDEAMERLGRFDRYELNSIPRVENAHADELVNQALDAAAG